jgi:glycosyltransferase involved in cell wall biosynthesis
MNPQAPRKVLITGGHEVGGVESFAAGLAAGFAELGIPAEVVAPKRLLSHWRELRDWRVLKILGTIALFAAPLARRAICIVHGVPRADAMGWLRVIAINAGYKLANFIPGTQLVAVSDYTAAQVRTTFNVRIDGVIRNPVLPMFQEPFENAAQERNLITFVGRLIPSKGVDRFLPAIRDVLDETPNLRACFIGEGELRPMLEEAARANPRILLTGALGSQAVRDWLRRTRVFVSGNPVEPFGITYVEAMTQGCVVAMPAGGGGLEIAPEQIGKQVQLLPISLKLNETVAALRRALTVESVPLQMNAYSARAVAHAYLDLDSQRAVPGHWAHKQPEAEI